MERWIKGVSLLKRWGALPFEVAALIRSGELVPVSETDGSRRTKDADPCLCCSVPDNARVRHEYGLPVECEHGRKDGQWGPSKCVDDYKPHRKGQRIDEARFKLSEVEDYEQAHGLGPLPHKPENAETLAETLRAAGITDAGMVARMVMAAYPMTERALGALMRGEKDDDGNKSANVKAARRLLDKE